MLKNPYACSLCKKGFPKPELLTEHVEAFHLPSKVNKTKPKKTLPSLETAPFKTNDRIFAKVKGYPAWPACVFGTNDVKGSRFKVYFYGTHETAIVKKEDMCFFEETTKVKFFKQKLGWLKKGFIEAIDEIENRPEIGYFKDVNPEESGFEDSKVNESAKIKVEIKDEPMEDGASGKANLEESKLDASILDESKENKSANMKVEITKSKKLFSCMSCNKNFASKQSLKYHENSKIHQNASILDESNENKSAKIKVEIKDEPMEDGVSGNANLEESILDESKESKSPNIKVEIKDEPEKGYPAWPQSLPLKKRKVADYGISTAIKKETQTTPVKIKSEDREEIANNSDEFSDVDGEDNWKVQILPPTKSLKLRKKTSKKSKNHFCTYCEKKFSSNHLLKQHLRRHTGERPFSCNYCEKRFTQSHSLQSHEFIHTGEKPFSCKVCSYSCRNSANLRKHELIHTGEKPFSCMYCNKKFATKQGQQIHEKSKMHQETEL